MKMKKYFKMLVAMLMAIMLLAGCGATNNGEVVMEDPNTVPEDSYEINWYLPIANQKDKQSVEEEINKYLKDKINVTVKLNFMETAQYKEKLSNMIQAGEYFDMCFAANWMLNYTINAENGAFYEFDTLLEKYMPKTLEASDKLCLECVKVGGKIYGLPVIKENAASYGWIYRKDLADKYNIDMSKVKSFEDLLPVAKMIKENEPSIKYPVDWPVDGTPTVAGITNFNQLEGYTVGYEKDDDKFTVKNRLELEETLEGYKLAHKFYNEELIKPDILTNYTDSAQRLKNGQTFCVLVPLKPGKVSEYLGETDYEFAQEYIIAPYKDRNIGMGSMAVISHTSKNPTRVARFIELLNSDKYLYNLVLFGIEGKHYEKVSDNVISIIKDGGYSLSGNQWMIGNVYNSYTTKEENPDKYEELKAFDDSATPHPLTGFKFVSDSVQAEITALSTVQEQYEKQISLGAIDPETIIDDYLAATKTAGIDKIIAEMQKQVDEFLASK